MRWLLKLDAQYRRYIREGTMGPETRLQRKIQDAITDRWPDAWIAKIHGGPYQTSGIPDLLLCVKGRFIALEVKHPDQDHPVTELQQVHLNWIERAGGVAAVVESVEEALDVVHSALAQDAVQPEGQ